MEWVTPKPPKVKPVKKAAAKAGGKGAAPIKAAAPKKK